MGTPTFITFRDEYVPDYHTIDAAAAALERGDPVEVQWPTSTAELFEEKERRRAGLEEDLSDLGGHDPRQYDRGRTEARRAATAPERLPRLSRALVGVDVTQEEARRGISMFLRFANLHILKGLGYTLLDGERNRIEDVFVSTMLLPDVYRSEPGRRALGTSEPIYSIDVYHRRRTGANVDVYAPKSLVEDLGLGDPITGELLVVWTIPQHELPHPTQIAGKDAEVDYGGGLTTVQKTRDEHDREL